MGSSDRRDFSDSRKTGNPKNPRLSRFYRWLAAKWQRSPRLRIGRTSQCASEFPRSLETGSILVRGPCAMDMCSVSA
jgi:hypothetical protein